RLVDRRRKHGAAMALVISGKVGTAAQKTDAQWRPRNDHRLCALLSFQQVLDSLHKIGSDVVGSALEMPIAARCPRLQQTRAQPSASPHLDVPRLIADHPRL